MIKKTLIGTAVLMSIGTFVFGRDVFSYARTLGSSVREAVKSEIPLEVEVQRARELVENLVPDIRNCMHVIAEQQVDIEHLSNEVTRKDGELDRQQHVILALRNDLDSGERQFVYASRTYTSSQVKRDLAQRFERFKVAKDSVLRDRQILVAREKSLVANEDKLDKMLVSKQELEVQIAQLEARLKTVQAAQTVATIDIDDSQLTRAKKLILELNKQLDVREKMLDAEGKFSGLIPVDAEPQTTDNNITEQIDEYFGNGNSEAPQAEVASVNDSSL